MAPRKGSVRAMLVKEVSKSIASWHDSSYVYWTRVKTECGLHFVVRQRDIRSSPDIEEGELKIFKCLGRNPVYRQGSHVSWFKQLWEVVD